VKRKALLKHFGSLDAIQKASETELRQVPGISKVLAAVIRRHFEGQAGGDQKLDADFHGVHG